MLRLKYDVSILQANWDSEKANRDRIYERMHMMEKTLSRIEDALDRQKEQKRWNFHSVLQTIMTMATLGTAIIMILKK